MSGTSPRTAGLRRLLVVDFDFFFDNPAADGRDRDYLYDWGHAETAFHRDGLLWQSRASAFLARGMPLPRCYDGYNAFWDRFRLADDCPLWIADSNAYAATLAAAPDGRDWRQVWLYDAHHDSGYRQSYHQWRDSQQVSCEDWTYQFYAAGADIHVRYPAWRTRALDLDPAPRIPVDRRIDDGRSSSWRYGRVFHGVFVCRSGSWVPAWCDHQWRQFLDACPIPAGRRHVMEPDVLAIDRWDEEARHNAEDLAAQYRRALTSNTTLDSAL